MYLYICSLLLMLLLIHENMMQTKILVRSETVCSFQRSIQREYKQIPGYFNKCVHLNLTVLIPLFQTTPPLIQVSSLSRNCSFSLQKIPNKVIEKNP